MKRRVHVAHGATATGLATLIAIGAAARPHAAQELEPLDLEAIALIRDEAVERSRIMETAWRLTDLYGARLTGSPALRAAAEWARDQMSEWGLADARLEPWDAFGPGWMNERFYAHVIEPQPFPLIGYPEAWTAGTDGWVRGEAVVVEIDDTHDFERYRGTLKGKFVLAGQLIQTRQEFEPLPYSPRFTEEELEEWGRQPAPIRFPREMWVESMRRWVPATRFAQFLEEEGAAAWLRNGTWESTSTGAVSAISPFVGHSPSFPPSPPIVALLTDHYGRIYRMLQHGVPVGLEMNVQNRWLREDSRSFNVLADIPGTDRADELVIVGAHLDCTPTGTGAVDDAAGVALVMEAARILKALDLPLRRTVRIALWSAEETSGPAGWGSFAYVNKHLFDSESGGVQPEHAKVSAYFNVDFGTGRFRGILGARTDEVAAVLRRWTEPFHAQGLTMVARRQIGGSDHTPFDMVGIPAFVFLQDMTTNSFAHTNLDTYERLLGDELKQNAAALASIVYHAANRDSLLKRLPPPREVQIPPDILDRYAGVYEDTPHYRITIEREGGRLIWRSGITWLDSERYAFELRPLSETEFFTYGPGSLERGRATVTFSLDEDGRVEGLRSESDGVYFDARRVSGAADPLWPLLDPSLETPWLRPWRKAP
jgi:hypothetical protein